MITIYHLDNSRSERIVWLMEELGLPYEMQTYMRENRAAPVEMRTIHPIGTAPLIRDGEQVIMESGAIVEYLITRHGNGRLMPAISSPDYVRYLEWLHFAEGTLMSNLIRSFSIGSIAKDSPMAQAGAARNERSFVLINRHLHDHAYFSGKEFTGADIMMEYCFKFVADYAPQTLAINTHIADWVQRVHARPAYQRMMAVAAPKVQIKI